MRKLGTKLSDETKQKMSIAHKGRKLSEETKRKIGKANSINHKGVKLSKERIAKIIGNITPYIQQKGEKHRFWKGGITSLVDRIRHSTENKKWIKDIFKRDNFTCQICNKRGNQLNAHHKIQFSILMNNFLKEYSQFSPMEDKETLLRLSFSYKPFWDIDNGKTLCADCHKIIEVLYQYE